MGSESIKDSLSELSSELNPQQFENFCKIVIKDVEQPESIEVTPFAGDGGIDIRGRAGSSFFRHEFGVQVKQNSVGNNVGKPVLRNFIGALEQHNYQYGCFITSSDFVSDADKVTDDQPIILINRGRLFDIMISNGLGVEQVNSSYIIDQSFWNLFDTTSDEDLVPSILVPQADSLDVMHVVLDAIYAGNQFKPQIKDYMRENTDKDSWRPRQADYYPNAALSLGLVHKDTKSKYDGRQMQRWSLTKSGREYMVYVHSGKDVMAKDYLNDCIRDVEIISRIIDKIRVNDSLVHSDIKNIISDETECTGSTVTRRLSTISNWMSRLPEINRVKEANSYRYDYVEKSLFDY